ncbi:hypothetical protein PFFVO_01701, partial [Plasmodium falciparum Vietnam Oak-Knoll (FVO)]
MVLPKRAPTATIDYTKVTNVKELLDLIGKYIQQKVHGEALEHSNSQLHGFLSKVIFSGGHKTNVFNKCDIDEQYDTNVTDGHSHPCLSRKDVRFSYTEGAECDKSKIKGSNSKSEGACAPLRRLSLCDQNLEHIKPENIKDTHNLYIDVLLAAKYEGQMIAKKLQEYDPTNYKSRICTELARSFADIGDIIRGKDLYLGYNKKEKAQKEKLEQNLKFFFQNIDDKLDPEAKNYYAKEKDPDFLKLREDWWELNRQDIWKALTCNAPNDAKYFRKTVCAGGTTPTHEKCTCASGDVPTYFDYVPQYLRWFDEWSEDFCRKKKKKLENVQKQCRGKYGDDDTERYCSRNGYDCEQTVNARGKLRYGKQCISCLYACNPYVEWIDKQRKQFDKQKNKYAEEIKKYTNGAVGSGDSRRQKRGAGGETATNYEGYEKKFYKELENRYGSVNAFLEKLSKEDVCIKVQDTEGGKINFAEKHDDNNNDKEKGTFYHSQYCQPCPLCGVKRESGKEWKEKNGGKCTRGNLYKPKPGAAHTDITILKSGEKHDDIKQKIDDFCTKTQSGTGDSNSNSSLYDPWKCYNDVEKVKNGDVEDDDEEDVDEVKGAGGLCILQNTNKTSEKEPEQFQKTFHDFFYYWVAHMLKDSIYWRTKKIKRCLENNNGNRCKNSNKCNSDCGCFERWVEKKKDEWDKIKIHFGKQDMGKNKLFGNFGHDFVLQNILEQEFLKGDSEDASAQDTQNSLDSEEIKHLKHLSEMLQKENAQQTAGGSGTGVASDNEKKTIMDKLIEHEAQEAEKCKNCQEPPKPASDLARSDTYQPQSPVPGDNGHHSEEEDDDDEDDEEEEAAAEEEKATEDGAVSQPEASPTTKDVVKPPCDIVDDLFKDTKNFEDACRQKYGGNNSRLGWKCIPSGDKTATERVRDADSADSAHGKSDASGSICVPPRRRKLYLGGFDKFISGESRGPTSATASSRAQSDSLLLTAFVESAAVETFFLWDRYKEEKKPQAPQLQLPVSGSDDPQEELQSGKIPDDFLRQMFYTLGDYRDILFSNTDIVLEALSSSDKENMQKIQAKIKKILNGDNNQESGRPPSPPSEKNSGQPITRESWWKQHAESIWNAMVCALTYDTDSEEKGDRAKPKHLEEVQQAFFGTPNGKPGLPGLQPGTYQSTYNYKTVELKEEVNGAKETSASPTSQTTKLTDFISRPPYFRYLEEWGETFCRQRTRMLEKIKEECMDGDGKKQKCSGDGLNCNETVPDKEKIYEDFLCPTCARHCSSYKKWITRKKDEFEEQKSAYTEQKNNYVNEHNDAERNKDDNGFHKTLENYNEAGAFLERLKSGPCKNDNENESGEDNQEDKIDFKDETKTFKPATNCKPCSQFKVKCINGVCNGDGKKVNCNGGKINAKDIGNVGNSTKNLDILVNDNNTNRNKFDDLKDACQKADIFKGIRKDEWECGKVCGVDICTLKKDKNGKESDKKPIIMKELLKRWLEYFFEDYNKINKKLNSCIKNGNGEEQKCYKGCKENCKCVSIWIEKKRTEWEEIKKEYIDKYTKENDDSNDLTNFLQQAPFHDEVNKAIKPCSDLKSFEKSKECAVDASSEKGKDGNKSYVIDCLLNKLEEKAKTCKDTPQTSDEQPNCADNSPSLDENEPLEETENPVDPPKICPKQTVEEPKETEEGEEKCQPADNSDEKKEEANVEETAKESTEESDVPVPAPAGDQKEASTPKVAPKPSQPPRPKHPNPFEHPAVIPSLVTSTLAWSVGIGFAAISYFFIK